MHATGGAARAEMLLDVTRDRVLDAARVAIVDAVVGHGDLGDRRRGIEDADDVQHVHRRALRELEPAHQRRATAMREIERDDDLTGFAAHHG